MIVNSGCSHNSSNRIFVEVLTKFSLQQLNYLFQWKPLAGSKSNGHSRIKMSTRNMANSINHHHHRQSPHYGNSRQCHNLVLVRIHHHGRTTSKNQEVCAKNLSYYLHKHNKQQLNDPIYKTK